jgi:hypothetical protein
MKIASWVMSGAFVASLVLAGPSACKKTEPTPDTCSAPGGAVKADADKHCGTTVQPTSQAACHPGAGGGGGTGGGGTGGGGTGGAGGAGTGGAGGGAGAAGGAGGGAEAEYGPTMNNQEGDDDDCKYHMAWTATPICENTDITFSLVLTDKSANKPSTGAKPYIEAFLDETHGAPKLGTSTETSAGNYTIGPVAFDAPGRWTVRFHVFGDCEDGETSPHSHGAFYVDVP